MNLRHTYSRRGISLTPMIDVVFLLLVFFMLVARFDIETAQPVSVAGGSEVTASAPRLIDVSPEGLRLNGVERSLKDIASELSKSAASPDQPIVFRPTNGASVQTLVDAMQGLAAKGFPNLVIIE